MSGEGAAGESARSKAAPRRRRVFRFSSIVTLLFIGLAAVILAYVAGVMSGRQSLGQKEHEQAVITPQTPESPDSIACVQGVLTAEELNFARALRGQPPTLKAENENEGVGLAPKETPPVVASQPEETESAPAPAVIPALQDKGILDYVFQMAAFKNENAVDALRQQLEGYGLRTRMAKEGKTLVVYVLMRGDAARAEEVIQIARSLKLGTPLIRSKKPVVQ